jgi:hypothetical protein
MPEQGTLTEGEGLSTVDLLVLTSSDQLLWILPTLFSFFFTKQATLTRRSTVLSLSLQLGFVARDLGKPTTHSYWW